MATIEKVGIEIVGNINKQSFQKASSEVVEFARDTKKKLDPLLTQDLRLNVANLQIKLDEARNILKQAKKDWDKETEFIARMQVNKLQSDVTEAKRTLNNYINTGEQWVSRLQRKFDQLGNFIKWAFGKIWVAIATAFWVRAIWRFINEIDDARKTIWELTGALWWQLNWLMDDFAKVLARVDNNASDVANALWEINTRFWVTGKPLQDLTSQFLDFADVTNQDVKTAIRDVSRLLQDSWFWLGRAWELMDILTVASQRTGISVWTLATNATNFGVQLRALWFWLEESVALISKFEAEWVNTEAILAWLNKWLNTLAKRSWTDIPTAFTWFIESLKNAKNDSEALKIASETLGAKAWPQLALAVREWRFELEEYLEALKWSAWATEATALATETVSEKFNRLVNGIKSNLIPVVNNLLNFLNPIIEKFSQFIEQNPKLVSWITWVTIAIGTLWGALLVLWWPVTAIIAWLTTIIWLWATTVVKFNNMTQAIRLYRDWIIDVNWNLTELWKKLEQQRIATENYRKQQEKTNNALQAFNSIKVDTTRTREQFELSRKAALAEADALLKAAQAYLARAYAAREVTRVTQWWVWTSPIKTWIEAINEMNIQQKEKEVNSLLKTIEDLNKAVYTPPKISWSSGWLLSKDWGKKSLNELKEAFKKSFESINKDIENSQKLLWDYLKDIEKIKTALDNLKTKRDEDLASRVVAIDQELAKTWEQALSTEERTKLEAERAEAFMNMSQEEIDLLNEQIARQKYYNSLTDIGKIKFDYEEKKKLLEKDLEDKIKAYDTEMAKIEELNKWKNLKEEEYHALYIARVQEQISLQRQLEQAAIAAARAMSWGWWGWASTTINNNQRTTTVNATISSSVDINSLANKLS